MNPNSSQPGFKWMWVNLKAFEAVNSAILVKEALFQMNSTQTSISSLWVELGEISSAIHVTWCPICPRHWALYLPSFPHIHFKSADQKQSYIICWGSRISYFGMAFYRHMGVERESQVSLKMRRSPPSGHKHRGSWGYPITTVTQHHYPSHLHTLWPDGSVSDFLTDLNISYHWPGASLARSGDWPLCVTQGWSQVRWLDTLSDMLLYPFHLWSKDYLKRWRKRDPPLIWQRASYAPTDLKATATS